MVRNSDWKENWKSDNIIVNAPCFAEWVINLCPTILQNWCHTNYAFNTFVIKLKIPYQNIRHSNFRVVNKWMTQLLVMKYGCYEIGFAVMYGLGWINKGFKYCARVTIMFMGFSKNINVKLNLRLMDCHWELTTEEESAKIKNNM